MVDYATSGLVEEAMNLISRFREESKEETGAEKRPWNVARYF